MSVFRSSVNPVFRSLGRGFASCATALNRRQDLVSKLNNELIAAKADFDSFTKASGSSQASSAKDFVYYNDSRHVNQTLSRFRVVPRDRAFYMSNPPHEEIMRSLNDMLLKNINLPVQENYHKASWVSIQEYTAFAGVSKTIKPSEYQKFVGVASRLDSIDPQLIPDEVKNLLNVFKKSESRNAKLSDRKYATLDEFGRAICVGRRKMASARIQMVKSGETHKGQVIINSKPLDEYFPKLQDRQAILYPLKVVDSAGSFNIFATVQGGGTTGQASAVAHGIANALVIHNPLLRTRLSKAKCLQRDKRIKERKKPGKPKARKSYTWVKR